MRILSRFLPLKGLRSIQMDGLSPMVRLAKNGVGINWNQIS